MFEPSWRPRGCTKREKLKPFAYSDHRANGFVGKNLQLHLAARKDVQVVCFTRSMWMT